MKIELKKTVLQYITVVSTKIRLCVQAVSRAFMVLLKFASILFLVFFIPKIVSVWSSLYQRLPEHRVRVLYGGENLVYNSQRYKALKRHRFWLFHDRSKLDQSRLNPLGKLSNDFLTEHEFSIKKVFELSEIVDKKVDLALEKENKSFDAFFVDVQDSGIYSIQLVAHLRHLLQVAARYKKKVVLLDRPNPLGRVVEGPGDIPWRHGLTIGELARYVNRHVLQRAAVLTVIPVLRWKRTDRIAGFRVSLNKKPIGHFLRAIDSIDPLTVEETSAGRGKIILLPKQEKLSRWEVRYLKRLCWHLGLHCVGCSGTDSQCNVSLHGVKLSLKNNINRFSALNTVLTVVRFLKNRKQIKLSYKKDFDIVFGSKLIRRFLEGELPFTAMKSEVAKSLQTFYDKSVHCCLYRPLPLVITPEIIKV